MLFIQPFILFHRQIFDIDDHSRASEGGQAQPEKGEIEFDYGWILFQAAVSHFFLKMVKTSCLKCSK
jgi:hypothetical protein